MKLIKLFIDWLLSLMIIEKPNTTKLPNGVTVDENGREI